MPPCSPVEPIDQLREPAACVQKDSKRKRSVEEKLNWGSCAVAVAEDGDGDGAGTQSHGLLWE